MGSPTRLAAVAKLTHDGGGDTDSPTDGRTNGRPLVRVCTGSSV